MVRAQRTAKCIVTLLCLIFFAVAPVILPASGSWKKVVVTEHKDIWYVEQILGFSSKGSVLSSRARLKFVPGKESAIGQNVKRGLLNDGVNADAFHHFIESVEVDCKKKFFTIFRIDFFDSEDSRIFGQTFAEPKQYPSTPGSVFEMISWDLCQNKPPFIITLKDTLKSKKPFLYFFSQGETAN
jgi:hypothetical protein